MGFKLKYNIGEFLVKFINSGIPTIDGHEYVDLGLPSGTLWAKCNAGAETETDFGQYFAWGETQGYSIISDGSDGYTISDGHQFNWDEYAHGTYDGKDTKNYGMTKYNATDGKTTLDLEDDAAHVNMGGIWRMPTSAQIEELIDASNTTHEVVTKSNITGMEFTSARNGNKLFIPFAGGCSEGKVFAVGEACNLWSSSLSSKSAQAAYYLNVDKNVFNLSLENRNFGCPVRGVCKLSEKSK